MKEYLALMQDVMNNGRYKENRTGINTYSVFSREVVFDLQKGFPLLTTKRTAFRLIATELLWFLSGSTNVKPLLEVNNNIWNEWGFEKWIKSKDYIGPDMTNFGRRCLVDEEFNKQYKEQLEIYKNKVLTDEDFANKYGELGNIYSKQWRSWEGADGKTYDQISWVINEIKNNPNSRRLLVNAWNAEDIQKGTMALPPCHYAFQFEVYDGVLNCKFFMRSTDVFLGLPFNIASYALLTHLIANECGLQVGELVYSGTDVHIYENHIEQCKLQLSREPKNLPQLVIKNKDKSIFDMTIEDFEIVGYESHPAIKAPVAV